MQDESNLRFHLMFNESTRQFMYVADEDAGPLDQVRFITPRLALDLGTGFIFYVDAERNDRKVLIGVFHRNAAQNNYFDGPADQLADNYIKDIDLRSYLHRAYPFTRGTVDEYGFYLEDDGNRVAISPYYAYRSLGEVQGMMETCGAGRVPVSQFLSCFSPDGRASSMEIAAEQGGGFPSDGVPGLLGTAALPALESPGSDGQAPLGPGVGGFFVEDWESGLGSWTATGLWHLITDPPNSCPPPAVYTSPITSAYFGIDASCDYATGVSEMGMLTSPVIPVVAPQSYLSYQFRRQTQGACMTYDRSRLELSVNGGPWTLVLEECDDSNTWKGSGPIDLSAYAGASIQFRFVFDTIDPLSNGFLGWMIDDVRIDTGDTIAAGGPSPWHMAGSTWHQVGVTFPPNPPVHLPPLTWHLVAATFPPPPPRRPHFVGITWNRPPPPPHVAGTTWHVAGNTWPPPRPIHAAGITWHLPGLTFIPPGSKHNSGFTWHYNGETFIPPGTKHNSGFTWHVTGESFIPPDTKHNSGVTWHYNGESFIPPGTIHNSGVTWHYNGQSFIPPGTKHNSGSTWHVNGESFIPAGHQAQLGFDVARERGELHPAGHQAQLGFDLARERRDLHPAGEQAQLGVDVAREWGELHPAGHQAQLGFDVARERRELHSTG